jgi:hypothetical protein
MWSRVFSDRLFFLSVFHPFDGAIPSVLLQTQFELIWYGVS